MWVIVSQLVTGITLFMTSRAALIKLINIRSGLGKKEVFGFIKILLSRIHVIQKVINYRPVG
jgi:hypothetical protein